MSSKAPAATKGHVFVVEDSQHTRNIFNYLFRQNGFEVTVFKNGQDAWRFMEQNSTPDLKLVFADIMMPEMSGIELVEKMRQNAKYKDTSVVLLTAVTDREVIQGAKELGVKAYVFKPISATKILECLRKIFPEENFIEIKIGG